MHPRQHSRQACRTRDTTKPSMAGAHAGLPLSAGCCCNIYTSYALYDGHADWTAASAVAATSAPAPWSAGPTCSGGWISASLDVVVAGSFGPASGMPSGVRGDPCSECEWLICSTSSGVSHAREVDESEGARGRYWSVPRSHVWRRSCVAEGRFSGSVVKHVARKSSSSGVLY